MAHLASCGFSPAQEDDSMLVTSVGQEVGPVEFNYLMSERPSALPAVHVCASAVSAPMSVAQGILAAGAPRAPKTPQAYQAQVQAELVRVLVPNGVKVQGTSGFTGGEGIRTSNKRMDVRGVPPRGRPV